MMTTWLPDSEVSQINSAAGVKAIKVSDETYAVIERAMDVSRRSKGIFDITVGAFAGLWKFDEDMDYSLPDQAEVKKRLALVGYKNVVLDAKHHTVKLKKKGMRITLGGIAKGYAVDKAVKILVDLGYADFIMQAGGDMYVSGKKGDKPWVVGIRDPRGPRDQSFAVAPVQDHSFSTSGDYERGFVKDGVRYLTPLFLVLLLIESTDLVFAVDSIPAIYGITHDPFIVYTSNIFAILGLRSMYFVLSGYLAGLAYLKQALAAILTFVGVKMLLVDVVHIHPLVSLSVIISILVIAVIFSLRKANQAGGLVRDLAEGVAREVGARILVHGTLGGSRPSTEVDPLDAGTLHLYRLTRRVRTEGGDGLLLAEPLAQERVEVLGGTTRHRVVGLHHAALFHDLSRGVEPRDLLETASVHVLTGLADLVVERPHVLPPRWLLPCEWARV